MIASRFIFGAQCDPELARELAPAGDIAAFCVFQTTASRGTRTRRVLCCWSGGTLVSKDAGTQRAVASFTMIGQAALDALLRLPACLDDHPAAAQRLIIREVKTGPTPLRDKVIDAILDAPPGARLCFLGDLAGELDGHMGPAFGLETAALPPIILDEEGRPV